MSKHSEYIAKANHHTIYYNGRQAKVDPDKFIVYKKDRKQGVWHHLHSAFASVMKGKRPDKHQREAWAAMARKYDPQSVKPILEM